MISLAETVLNGDRLALARLLTQVENDTSDGRVALAFDADIEIARRHAKQAAACVVPRAV